jgi:Fic family protein
MPVKLHDLDARSEALSSTLSRLGPERAAAFQERLDMSWVYHDHALEGVVLSYQELSAGFGKTPVAEASSIPAVNDIQAYKKAIDFIREAAQKKKLSITQDLIKRVYGLVARDENLKNAVYRKDNPLHRLYFHEISPPEKIAYTMRKTLEWLVSEEAKRMHPVKQAATLHFKLIAVYPFQNHSGKVARLMMNLLLLRAGYQPGIIHATERQRYYESLRTPQSGLLELVHESLDNALENADRYFAEESEQSSSRRAS